MGQAVCNRRLHFGSARRARTVDTSANSGDLSGIVEISHALANRAASLSRTSGFGESRDNGTPLQRNDTTIPEIDLGADWASIPYWQLFDTALRFHGIFSSDIFFGCRPESRIRIADGRSAQSFAANRLCHFWSRCLPNATRSPQASKLMMFAVAVRKPITSCPFLPPSSIPVAASISLAFLLRMLFDFAQLAAYLWRPCRHLE